MNTQWLSIRGLDPLLLRDGRPFSTDEGGNAARTLALPLPSTLAGFVRTREGNARGVAWTAEDASHAEQIAVHGPLLCRGGEVFVPTPRDALIFEDNGRFRALPLGPMMEMDENCGCDLPAGLFPLRITRDVKPASGHLFWPLSALQEWLARSDDAESAAPAPCAGLEREVRFHNKIDPQTRTVDRENGALFSVELVAFEKRSGDALEQWSLLARVPGELKLERAGSLGGERRLATVEAAPDTPVIAPTNALREAMRDAKRVRMQLATPAAFAGGWRPGWIEARSLEGAWNGVRLKLVAAAVGRREAVSGWDLRTRQEKAVKPLAPAGSTYFFQVQNGEPLALLDGWLAPVCDDAADARNGFGLALWGVW